MEMDATQEVRPPDEDEDDEPREVSIGVPSSSEAEAQQQLEICRVCLLEDGPASMRGLFQEEEDADDSSSSMLSEKAMRLASVKIMPGDGLPSQICCDCSDKLESAYKFKLQVEQADTVLRDRLDLHIKEELFFGDVDVNLTSHKSDVEEIMGESLLLKDHMDLLDVRKIREGDIDSQSQDIEKQIDNVDLEQHEIEKHDAEEMHQQLIQDEQMHIQSNEEVMKIHNEQQIENQESDEQQIQNKESDTQRVQSQEEMQQVLDEQHNQSFETQELQEMMLNEISEQERMQEELNQTQQLAMHEHNYVAEAQPCQFADKNNASNPEEMEQDSKENIEKEPMNEQIDVYGVPQESSPSEAIRRSKRNINLRKAIVDRDSDEENYFENLNLSSRLKKVQSEKSEKIYYMCYLCDRQFLSKDVLKEHMHSHEEVRKTLSLSKKSPEKLLKTPEKSQIEITSPTSSKPPSSGKRPSTCPHCGKEYLYIISFNKHLKQHEREKQEMKVDSMPLEVSFQEDDDILDFHDYGDNPAMDSDSEEEIKKEDDVPVKNESKKHGLMKCNVCEEQFDDTDKLKEHRTKHVVEGILTEQDLQDDIKQFEVPETTPEAPPSTDDATLEPRKPTTGQNLSCPHCPAVYAHKKSLSRHVDSSHRGAKFACKLCHQSFSRKDHLRRHAEQHGSRLKSFRCTQCNKSFGNELTLRNHLIATNHKTTVHGQEYDPNKRIKRVAAKAAQRIIDQIKTDLRSDEEEEREEEEEEEEEEVDEERLVKEEVDGDKEEMATSTPSSKRHPRSAKSLVCQTCNHRCPTRQALTKHMEQHVKDEAAVKKTEVFLRDDNDNDDDNENGNDAEDNDEDDDYYEGGLGWPIDSHECPTCKKKYSTKKSLLRHQLLHEEPNFECDICNVKFYRKDKLKAHYDKCSEKNPDQVRKCNICGDTFENNEILREHRAKHVMEGILTEEDLREIEPRPEDRSAEKATRKRRTDIVGLECTECNKRYTSRKGLLRHIQVHEGKKYLCDICPKKFYRREHLKIHVAKHNMIKPYKCPRCPKRFIKEEQVNSHVQKHDRQSTRKVNKETDTAKRFLCEICSKSFTQSTTLIAHLRAHNGIKPYVCEVCSRPFTTNAYLKMHMRTHTQERPYICQYCSRAFARADTLANHLTSHTGEAKYHCKYCPKNFRRLKSLKEHVFIHTGQRPYACPTCDRRFNNNGSRYAHSKRCKQIVLQIAPSEITVQSLNVEQEMQEMQDIQDLRDQQDQQDQEDQDQDQQQQQLQLQELQEHMQLQQQQQRIHQAQLIKPQSIKTITIARPDGTLSQQHVMTHHQEILMPLILPVTVTLADVGEEVILPEGTKIFTA